jgi:GT2 family glycosyltransferase
LSATAPDLTVSLVNTSNRELLLACLGSLERAARQVALQVVVVDNASDDGSAEAVAVAYPDVELVRRTRRHGFAANHNAAIARARGRYVLVLNEDTELEEGSLDRLVSFMDQNPHIGAVGPRIVYPDGSEQPAAWRFPTPARVALTTVTLQRAFWQQSGGDRIRRVDWVCGAALLARTDAVQMLEGLDERFFLYSEDVDLCRRLRDAGWEIAWFPHASLVHHENASSASAPERRIYQFARGRAQYARKHHGRAGEAVVLALTAAAYGGRLAAACLLALPGLRRAKRVEPWQRARFAAHARASLRPWSRDGIEDAAAAWNREREPA